MPYIIAGLGNPGEEYVGTRHNTGRDFAMSLSEEDFSFDKKSKSLVSSAKIGKEKVKLILPETFMNKSGAAVAYFVKNPKAAEKLVVIYDDFNLPIGSVRISFNRSSGGHNGVESIIRSLKTEGFLRVRIGVAPEKKDGNAKVPHGDSVIEKFILGKFKPDEVKELKKVKKKIEEGLAILIEDGKEKAMSIVNAN